MLFRSSKITTLKKKSSVVLTTHSMEEADALSTKLGIMVNGHFKCFGTVQHLKSKFGNYYEIEFRTNSASNEEALEMLRCSNLQEGFMVTDDNLDIVLRSTGNYNLINEFSSDGLGNEIMLND